VKKPVYDKMTPLKRCKDGSPEAQELGRKLRLDKVTTGGKSVPDQSQTMRLSTAPSSA
jgi:hypothetical protein